MIASDLQDNQRVEDIYPLINTFFDYVKIDDLLHVELGRFTRKFPE